MERVQQRNQASVSAKVESLDKAAGGGEKVTGPVWIMGIVMSIILYVACTGGY